METPFTFPLYSVPKPDTWKVARKHPVSDTAGELGLASHARKSHSETAFIAEH